MAIDKTGAVLDTIIIGSGISGLLAGSVLQQSGQTIEILDKGRRAGGRMATRRLSAEEGSYADHGAQFFTVREAAFQRWIDRWLAEQAAVEWCRGFSGRDGYPRYRGVAGMASIPQAVAQNLPIKQNCKVVKIETVSGRWRAHTEDGEMVEGKQLLLTPPVPQSLALIRSGGVNCDPAVMAALAAIEYDRCFAALVQLASPSSIPKPGGVQVRGPIIDWIGDNQQKGISDQPTVTIHASADWSQACYEHDRDEVGQLLVAAAAEAGYFSVDQVVATTVHRWAYAQPITCYPERCLRTEVNGLPLVFAGDAFKHARVEGAALSGLAAAQVLIG